MFTPGGLQRHNYYSLGFEADEMGRTGNTIKKHDPEESAGLDSRSRMYSVIPYSLTRPYLLSLSLCHDLNPDTICPSQRFLPCRESHAVIMAGLIKTIDADSY